MNFPEDLRYTQEHEWVRVDGTTARVGITDYAQDALGDVVYVDLPEVGATVAAMASCCEVESTKSVSEIFSPVSGTVSEVNIDLADTPQVINEDPYGKGWIFAVEMADPDELNALMDAAAYQAFLGEQQ
ncbi:MAG: glycine cleavage system protein GcvH [Actinomycetota bacterium]|jgi:glycine cleavage system H protein